MSSRQTSTLIVEPFLHIDRRHLENPLTGRRLEAASPRGRILRALLEGKAIEGVEPELRESLAEQGWLVVDGPNLDRRYRLRFVSLETHSVCNQACTFCPVSVAPRPKVFMDEDLILSIADQLKTWRESLEAIFFHHYNEPTLDRRLPDHIRLFRERDLPVAMNSNGSGLTPKLCQQIMDAGGLELLSINLSTLDAERYRAERGSGALETILGYLESAGQQNLSERMHIAVLGDGGRRHRADHAAIEKRFAQSRWQVRRFRIEDRAGWLPFGLGGRPVGLAGCANFGSRPFEHLHVTATGRVVLCCEDYSERHPLGELTTQSIASVLEGPEIGALRREIYGLDAPREDLLCQRCYFARPARIGLIDRLTRFARRKAL